MEQIVRKIHLNGQAIIHTFGNIHELIYIGWTRMKSGRQGTTRLQSVITFIPYERDFI